MSGVVYRPALPAEYQRALGWLYRHSSAAEQLRLIVNTLNQIEGGGLSPQGLLVAVHEERVVGCIFGDSLPGRFGLVWTPQGQDPTIELCLLQRLSQQLLTRHARVLLAFVDVDDETGPERLQQADYRYVTRVFYLTREVSPNPQRRATALEFRRCDGSDVRFVDTLAHTYIDSLDCPELNHVRSPEEVLIGYQAEARSPPDWFCLEYQGEAVGVLLLYPNLATSACELTYLGIVPAHRGQGWGRAALEFAENYAASLSQRSQWLSVDSRNEPAMQLYRRFGFHPFDRRDAWCFIPSPNRYDADQKSPEVS